MAISSIHGNATDNWTDGDRAKKSNFFDKVKADFDALLGARLGHRNIYAGGARSDIGLVAESTGDKEIWNAQRIEIDNTGSDLTGYADDYGHTMVIRFRYWIRVTNAGITVTPKIRNETDASFATIVGAAATSGTATDFSGSNQQQTITLTAVAGKKVYVPYITVGGTPAAGYQAFVHVMHDLYVQL